MEIFFNAAWALLAFGAATLCLRQSERWLARRRLLALACMSALLFPVISITDDLHFQQDAFDDSAGRKIQKSIDRASPLRTATLQLPAFPTTTAATPRPVTSWAASLPAVRPAPLQAHAAGAIARAPPVLLSSSL